jgi:hypothetical protein
MAAGYALAVNFDWACAAVADTAAIAKTAIVAMPNAFRLRVISSLLR